MFNRNWCVVGLTMLAVASASAADLLAPGDLILAIDTDEPGVNSAYPANEAPASALDNDSATKYLNFGKEGAGLIFEPFLGPTVVQSMVLRTANDFEGRDPATWELFGTNDILSSPDNSDGNSENWTLIESGDALLPSARFTDGPVYSFPQNLNAFSAYKIRFPTVKDPDGIQIDSVQIADINLFESDDSTGVPIGDSVFDDARAFGPIVPQSNYPGNEGPAASIDGDIDTKYLNFGKENVGFIVTPSGGASIVDSFQITTANDFEERDPSSWELYGTNDAILSTDNSRADGGEQWTLIDSGSLALPVDRQIKGDVITVDNTAEYTSYQMVFPTVKDAALANSLQYADIQFFGEFLNPSDPGDFNSDGNWDCADIDALVAAVAAGTNDVAFDMNADGSVDAADVQAWLVTGGANNPGATDGNAFLNGDANLDGVVDVSDFNIWSSNKFASTPAWCSGDFNADGVVDVSDFNIWSSNKFQASSNPSAVPEPQAWCLAIVAGWAVLRRR